MYPAKNLVYTEITGTPYTDSETSITVSDGSVFSDPSTDGEFEAVIYNKSKNPGAALNDGEAEVVRVTAISTNTLTVTRGQGGTSAIALGSGTDWAIVQGITKAVIEQIQDRVLDVTDYGAEASAGVDSTQAFQDMADELGYVNVPFTTTPFEIDDFTTTQTTVFNAVHGYANIKLQTPTTTNDPAITLAHANSGIGKGFHFDANSTSRTIVKITADNCFAYFTSENVTADSDSTTSTSGLIVEGNDCTFDVYGESYSNTGQSNESVPRIVSITNTADRYKGAVRGYDINCGVVTGSSVGRGEFTSVNIEQAVDNGFYQLGSGVCDIGEMTYKGDEEAVIVGSTMYIGKLHVIGGGTTGLSLNDGDELRVGSYKVTMNGTESLSTLMRTRAGAGFGTVQVDSISGRQRGNKMFNLGNANAVESLIIGGVDIDYEYDAGVSGLISQWCNFEDCERFVIHNFKARIIDVNDVLTGSDDFEFRLPTVTKSSQLFYTQIEIYDSDESTASSATFSYSGTDQDDVYFINYKKQIGSWSPVYEGSTSGTVSASSQRYTREGAKYHLFFDDVADLSTLSGDITITGLPADAAVRGVSILTHGGNVSYPSGATALVAMADGSAIELKGYGSGTSTNLSDSEVSGTSRYVFSITYRA